MSIQDNQAKIIELLKLQEWEEDGQSQSLIPGGYILKPRFKKGNWKIVVGKMTTTIYLKPDNPETMPGAGRLAGQKVLTFRDWQTTNIPTKDIDAITEKLKSISS
jgi:hypothetical protein